MLNRTRARHVALKALYQVGLVGCSPDEALDNVIETEETAPPKTVREFAKRLVDGVFEHSDKLDTIIRPFLTAAWKLERLGLLERCVLRLATFEFTEESDVPCRVTLDEAVELAKIFIGTDAARLVNGVLHSVAKEQGLQGLEDASAS